MVEKGMPFKRLRTPRVRGLFTRMKGRERNLLPLEDGSQKTLKVQGLVMPMLSSCRCEQLHQL